MRRLWRLKSEGVRPTKQWLRVEAIDLCWLADPRELLREHFRELLRDYSMRAPNCAYPLNGRLCARWAPKRHAAGEGLKMPRKPCSRARPWLRSNKTREAAQRYIQNQQDGEIGSDEI